jgi:antitoxin (DNA-binding transcriptional repressor) of toxin-antitoxin stability system
MKKLSIREARQALSHLDRVLDEEGEVALTRRGKVIARVVGIGQTRPIPSHKGLRREMALLRKGSEKLVREDRDAR